MYKQKLNIEAIRKWGIPQGNYDQDRPYKILAIEDESTIRQSIRTYLEDYGFIVFEAENGREGIEIFQRELPDLVLSDLRMPEMDGLEVLERLSKMAPDTPLVVASGTGNMNSLVHALHVGAWDYIFKPIEDMGVLKHAIEKCLKESRLKKENRVYQERLEDLVRKRTLELEKSEQLYKAVFEYTGTAAIIIEQDDVISMVNSKFAQLVGMERDAIEGKKKWHEFISARDITVMENHLRARAGWEPESSTSLQYEVELATGSVSPQYVYVSLGMIPGTKRQVASLLDVTEKKRAERRWHNLEKQLRKAHKMEAIGTLAGGIAHDLNNILSPVMGYSDMIMNVSETGSQVFEWSGKIRKAAFRAATLVSKVLEFNRTAKEEKRRVRLHPVILEAVTLLRGSIPSTITIIDRIDRNCDAVMADPTQIHQVMMNLCTNAYHAMEDSGGELTVGLSQVELTREDMVLYPSLSRGAGTYLVLEVNDTGCGMTGDVVDRIFDPYFTTKEEGKGTGLGLATAYRIIQACHGEIRVKSIPGKGSCFSVFIPTVQADGENDSPERKRGTRVHGTGEHLLVVDDDPDIAAMWKEGVESMGYTVDAFRSSTEALAFFKANYRDIDLVVTDQTMPGKTGLELIRQMRTLNEELPVILCSGYSAAINQEVLADAGVQRFVMKPITVAALAREIHGVLNSRRLVTG